MNMTENMMKKRMIGMREKAINSPNEVLHTTKKHVWPRVCEKIDGDDWFYCRVCGHKIPLCKMTTCQFFPCKPMRVKNNER